LEYFEVSVVLFRKEKLLEIRDRIVQGSEELFFKFGVKSITMDDIAKHLAVSKKTIYQFFKDKNELICTVTDTHLESSEKIFQSICETSADPIDELLKIGDHIKVMFQNMNPSLLYEIQKYYPKAFAIYIKHKETCIRESIVKNLVQGIEKGLYRGDLDVEVISILRMEQVQAAFNPFVFPSQKFDLKHVQMQLIDHFLHGICTLKGHKLINFYKQINEED
jgi:TetR/AcrR family transcriptional regulator, cholesterol catabolism regulator